MLLCMYSVSGCVHVMCVSVVFIFIFLIRISLHGLAQYRTTHADPYSQLTRCLAMNVYNMILLYSI